MNDKPIGVGDLVQVIKPTYCCGNTDSLGTLFIVGDVNQDETHCGYCMEDSKHELKALDMSDGYSVQFTRLKRIPPLSELDEVKETEELVA